MIEVPGKNGDIIIDHGRYRNIEITYPAFIVKDFKANLTAWANKLLEPLNYVRLSDTYHQDEFRIAVLSQGMVVDPVRWLAAGSFDIVFNCRPERFLTNGEVVMSFNASGNITNATDMPSRPLIRVYGDGSITVNGTEIEIAPHSYTYANITEDSSKEQRYKSGTDLVGTHVYNKGTKLFIIQKTAHLYDPCYQYRTCKITDKVYTPYVKCICPGNFLSHCTYTNEQVVSGKKITTTHDTH
jgi:phage-related protein